MGFQDIGIATYLMLLWKATFSSGSDEAPSEFSSNRNEPWKKWPRPPGGFLDLGYAYTACMDNSHFLSDVAMVC